MGEVREMLDGWWHDGFNYCWATRELAEQAHEQKKNFTGPVPTRDYEVETEQEAVDANRQEIDGMFAALDDKIDHAAKIRNAEISAANAARNAGVNARDEYMATEQLNAEIQAAHRASAAPVVKAEPLVFKMDEGTAEVLGFKAPHWTRREIEAGSGYGQYMTTGIYFKGERALEVADCFPGALVDLRGSEDGFIDYLIALLNADQKV